MTRYRRSPIAWPGTVGPDPNAELNPYVREEGGYLIREDGSPLMREKPFSEDNR